MKDNPDTFHAGYGKVTCAFRISVRLPVDAGRCHREGDRAISAVPISIHDFVQESIFHVRFQVTFSHIQCHQFPASGKRRKISRGYSGKPQGISTVQQTESLQTDRSILQSQFLDTERVKQEYGIRLQSAPVQRLEFRAGIPPDPACSLDGIVKRMVQMQPRIPQFNFLNLTVVSPVNFQEPVPEAVHDTFKTAAGRWNSTESCPSGYLGYT